MKRTFCLLAMVCIVLTGCSPDGQSVEKEVPQKSVSDSSIHEQKKESHLNYPWANSTGIYTMKDYGGIIGGIIQYDRDGEVKDVIGSSYISSYNDYCMLKVDDEWLYFYLWDEENSWWLYRIPFIENENSQIVLDYENKEKIYDTSNMWDFCVIGNYFVGLTKQQVMLTMNMESKRNKETKKLPESLRYSSKKDEYWTIVGYGEDWVLWLGNGLFLQKVPSNEIIQLETKKNVWYDYVFEIEEKDFLCLNADECECKCYKFDGTSKLIFDKAMVKNEISKMFSEEIEIKKCQIDRVVKRDEKLYLQIKYRKKEGNWTERYALLVFDNNTKKFLCDEDLNYCLPSISLISQWWEMPEADFLGIYEDNWYIQRGEEVYVYNEEFKTFKLIKKGDPEWNCFYAINQSGLD